MNTIIEILLMQGRRVDIARTVIMLLLLTLAAKPAADLTWKVLGAGDKHPSVLSISKQYGEKGSEKRSMMQPEPATDLKSAAEYHLFGQAGRVIVAPVLETVKNVPKTNLNLVLKGVVAAVPMDKALAIINDKQGKEEDGLYGVGDMVLGLAEVREIYADRVILLRSGRLETLMLIDSETEDIGMPAAGGRSSISSKGDGLNWSIDPAYWNQQINDIPALASQVGVDIYRENNVQKGFKLLSSRGNQLLSDLGLQPGDILYEVNGIKLNNAHNGLMAYQKIKNASQITLKIGREGRMMTRLYSIK